MLDVSVQLARLEVCLDGGELEVWWNEFVSAEAGLRLRMVHRVVLWNWGYLNSSGPVLRTPAWFGALLLVIAMFSLRKATQAVRGRRW